MEKIAEEGYNLNISRHISKKEISLEEAHANLLSIDKAIRAATDKHNVFLRELGLPVLPGGGARD